jgi:hypothetical protein
MISMEVKLLSSSSQHGGIDGVSARNFADQDIVMTAVSAPRAMRLFTPYLAGSIGYVEEDLWVLGAFERDGPPALPAGM